MNIILKCNSLGSAHIACRRVVLYMMCIYYTYTPDEQETILGFWMMVRGAMAVEASSAGIVWW